MDNLIQENELTDLNLVMAEARILSIQFRHGFIDYTHLFVAVLSVDCEARGFCTGFDSEKWKAWLQNVYPATGNKTMNDSVNLTVFAEQVIRYGYKIARANGDEVIDSVHLLLSLLCIKCDITDSLSTKGIIFDDIADQYYPKPIIRTVPSIPVLRKEPYPQWRKFFMTGKAKKKKAEEFYRQAYELSLYQLYDESLLVCEAGLSLEPDNIDLRKMQLHCFVGNLDFQAALPCAKQLANDYPHPLGFTFTLGYIYDELGQYEEAARIYDKILVNYPEEKTTLNNKGFNLSRQARYKEAVPYYEKAISIDAGFAYSWNNLGFAKYKLGRIDEGLELINKSLKLDKGNSYAYKNKGIIYLEQNDKEKALQNFQLALRYGYTKKYGNEVLELMKGIN